MLFLQTSVPQLRHTWLGLGIVDDIPLPCILLILYSIKARNASLKHGFGRHKVFKFIVINNFLSIEIVKIVFLLLFTILSRLVIFVPIVSYHRNIAGHRHLKTIILLILIHVILVLDTHLIVTIIVIMVDLIVRMLIVLNFLIRGYLYIGRLLRWQGLGLSLRWLWLLRIIGLIQDVAVHRCIAGSLVVVCGVYICWSRI